MTYQDALNFLYSRLPVFHLKGISAYKPGLDNTLRLLQCMGNPHQTLRCIHIAGTNGKGSVSHMLASVFQEAGYKTGLFTSPHLVDFGERIRVNGKMIDRTYVADFVEKYVDVIEQVQPSFFELTMAMAFRYFNDCGVTMAIIETGLGGRLDSTNVITPVLSIITNIGFDHMDVLGHTLPQIAFEKAGIIKPGIPVVIGERHDETNSVFVEMAKRNLANVYFAESVITPESVLFAENMQHFYWHNERYSSALKGLYQQKNITTVLASVTVLREMGYALSNSVLQSGLEWVTTNTELRGRWELVQKHPTVVLDTAHNAHGIDQITKQISRLQFQNLRMVIGMVNDKDISAVLNLLPKQARYYFCKANTQRSLSELVLKEKANNVGLMGFSYTSVSEAIRTSIAEAHPNDLIVITGSNFVVGEAIREVFI